MYLYPKSKELDEIQKHILEILVEETEKNPTGYGVHRSIMQKAVDISDKDMDFIMAFLEQRGLVKLVEAPNYSWLWAKVTPAGKRIIQESNLPKESNSNLSQKIADNFQLAYDLTNEKNRTSKKKKRLIIDNLNRLEEELAKEEIDAGKIQLIWKWLHENASWILPALSDTVLEGMKHALFLD
jgi:repressor of nif and glnA expression